MRGGFQESEENVTGVKGSLLPMGKLLEKFNPALLEYIYQHALF